MEVSLGALRCNEKVGGQTDREIEPGNATPLNTESYTRNRSNYESQRVTLVTAVVSITNCEEWQVA